MGAEPRNAGSPAGSAPRYQASASKPTTGAAGATATNRLEPGDPRRVGEYDVLAQLGFGGMGTVYLGRSPSEELVAIKLVHRHLAVDAEFRARFTSEVAAGRRVPPFCSARVLDAGYHEGRPYLVTEYIDGVSLAQFVAEDGPLDLTGLHALALGTAAGLAAIHTVGLVHRDVKPSNIMMTLGGVRIIDFGIARALDDTAEYTRSGVVMGSLGWAAPEQLGGEGPSPAMDVFGWGCVIGFAATGEHPFGGADLNARAFQVLHGDPNLTGVPEPLRTLVAAALQRSPAHRPAAKDLLFSLVGAVAAPQRPKHLRTANMPRRAAGVLAAAVPLALAVIVSAASGAEFGLDSSNGGHKEPTVEAPTDGSVGHEKGGPGSNTVKSKKPGRPSTSASVSPSSGSDQSTTPSRGASATSSPSQSASPDVIEEPFGDLNPASPEPSASASDGQKSKDPKDK